MFGRDKADFKYELGTKAKDKVTGVEGTVLCRTQWLTGCNTYGLQRPVKEDGDVPDAYYTDEDRLEAVEAERVEVRSEGGKRGGPAQYIPDPARRR